MKYFTIFLVLSVSACNANDNPEINGQVIPNVTVTEINIPNTTQNTSTPLPITPKPSPITSPHSTTTPAVPTTSPVMTTTSAVTTTPASKPTIKPEPSTTPKPSSTSGPHSTTAPVTTTTASPHHDRKFDGPSFVGGIILAFGLVAIGFVAFRFYKARNENYRTL